MSEHRVADRRAKAGLKTRLYQTRCRLRAAVLAATLAVAVGAAVSSLSAAPTLANLTLRDVDGRIVRPFDTSAAAVAFVFVRTDCPISNRYAPEVTRLHTEFAKRSVAFHIVYPGAQAAADIRRHVKEFGYPGTPLLDPMMKLVDATGVKITPEAAIYDRSRSLVYHGRLDDRYVDIGKYRPEPTTRDVRDVLTALLTGRPAPYASRPAVGCFIEDLR